MFPKAVPCGGAVIRNATCICFSDLAALVAGAHPKLVDLRFSHVGPLLRVVQLVLELPVLGQVAVGLLLLQTGARVW